MKRFKTNVHVTLRIFDFLKLVFQVQRTESFPLFVMIDWQRDIKLDVSPAESSIPFFDKDDVALASASRAWEGADLLALDFTGFHSFSGDWSVPYKQSYSIDYWHV